MFFFIATMQLGTYNLLKNSICQNKMIQRNFEHVQVILKSSGQSIKNCTQQKSEKIMDACLKLKCRQMTIPCCIVTLSQM